MENTHPNVGCLLVSDVFERDGAVGDKLIRRDGCIMENGERDGLCIPDLRAEVLIPDRLKSLWLGGGAA